MRALGDVVDGDDDLADGLRLLAQGHDVLRHRFRLLADGIHGAGRFLHGLQAGNAGLRGRLCRGDDLLGALADLRARMGDLVHGGGSFLHGGELLLHAGCLLLGRGADLRCRGVQVLGRLAALPGELPQPVDHGVEGRAEMPDLVLARHRHLARRALRVRHARRSP